MPDFAEKAGLPLDLAKWPFPAGIDECVIPVRKNWMGLPVGRTETLYGTDTFSKVLIDADGKVIAVESFDAEAFERAVSELAKGR